MPPKTARNEKSPVSRSIRSTGLSYILIAFAPLFSCHALCKAVLEEALKEIDFQILVVIDDVDRLPNDQIRLIFQLVNSVAGFPHMVYLLSYDKDIVARALDDVQGRRGAEYLEKIIQVPFDMPPINKYRVRSILKDEVKKCVICQVRIRLTWHIGNKFSAIVLPLL